MAVLLTILTGWLLKIGQGILIPIFAATISVYVLTTTADALGKLPGLKNWPAFLRRLIVLIGFAGIVTALGMVAAVTIKQIIATAPSYQQNLEELIARGVDTLGYKNQPDWKSIRALTIGQINIQALFSTMLASLGSLGGTLFLIIIYSSFLMSERGSFATKLAAAMRSQKEAARTEAIILEINTRIGDYLAIKTLINVILATISYIVLWVMGVDFALFWALIIGLFNYIPYVGSIFGVIFPVLLALAQFGSIQTMLLVAAPLIIAQTWVGNVLEPRMIGKQVNLSPFIVLVALSVWSTLWGLPGAILAIPLTSMLTIIFSAFAPTRPLAILLAENVEAIVTYGKVTQSSKD